MKRKCPTKFNTPKNIIGFKRKATATALKRATQCLVYKKK